MKSSGSNDMSGTVPVRRLELVSDFAIKHERKPLLSTYKLFIM